MRLVVAAERCGRRASSTIDAVIGRAGHRRPAPNDRLDAAEQQQVARADQRRRGGARGGGLGSRADRASPPRARAPAAAAARAGRSGAASAQEILALDSPGPTCPAGRYWAGRCGSAGRRRRPRRGCAAQAGREPARAPRASRARRVLLRAVRRARAASSAPPPARRRRTGRRCRSRRASQDAAGGQQRRRPTGFQAKPVNSVPRSHSVTIQAAARQEDQHDPAAPCAQRQARPAAAAG